MPKQHALTRTARGLYTRFNPYHEVPEGAFLEADNCVTDNDGMASRRRGMNRFGNTSDFDDLFEFTNRLVGHEVTGSKLRYDSDGNGVWTDYTGSFARPEAGARMRSLERDLRLYLTTSEGIYSTAALTTAPKRAGIQAGLDVELALASGTGLDWFSLDSSVGYRIVWGRVDANQVLQQGAPSMREVLTNPATAVNMTRATTTVTVTDHTAHGYSNGDTIKFAVLAESEYTPTSTITVTGANTYTYTIAADDGPASSTGTVGKVDRVTVKFTVPDEIEEGDFYEIYRTDLTTAAATNPPTAPGDPGDVQKLVFRGEVSATDITNRDASPGVPITFTDTFFPAFLTDQLYTNTTREGIANANSRPPWAKDLAEFKGIVYYGNTKREQLMELQLIEVSGLVAGTSSITLTQGATVETYTFAASENISNQEFLLETSQSTLEKNLELTMKSFVRVLNRDNTQTLWYAYYVSGILDGAGAVVIECRKISTGVFSLTCNDATTQVKFSPTIPTSGTLYSSDNERLRNGLSSSKPLNYDAVPEGNVDEIGDPQREIIRLVPTKDSLWIIKEDGVWRLTGESQRNITIKPMETNVLGRAPDTWQSFDNAAVGLSTLGVVRVSEAGTEILSRQIEDKIDKVLTYTLSLCHAIPYESEFRYHLFCPDSSTDTRAKVAWVYDTLNRAWTGPWRKPVKAGVVTLIEDRMYWQHTDDGFVLQERKDFLPTDFIDEEIACTVDAVTTTTFNGRTVTKVSVTFNYTTNPDNPTRIPEPGWLFRKTPTQLPHSIIEVVDNTAASKYDLTLSDEFPGLTTGNGELALPIPMRVRWVPEDGDNAGTLKHFTWVQIYLAEAGISRAKVGFRSDITQTEVLTDNLLFDQTAGKIPLRLPIPTSFQRCRTLSVAFENSVGNEDAKIGQVTYTLRQTGDMTTKVPA